MFFQDVLLAIAWLLIILWLSVLSAAQSTPQLLLTQMTKREYFTQSVAFLYVQLCAPQKPTVPCYVNVRLDSTFFYKIKENYFLKILEA